MRWFTVKEFIGIWGEKSYDNPDISQWAAELGDGWRMWATLIPFTILFAGIAFLFGLPRIFAGIICFVVVFAPVAMTGGYLLGAEMRGFRSREVLKIAYRHIK